MTIRSEATAPLPRRGRGREERTQVADDLRVMAVRRSDDGSERSDCSPPRGGEGGGEERTQAAAVQKKGPDSFRIGALQRTAAAYSPTWWGSTIGDGGLNFSVRNGKRWYPAAIATAVYYLRETTNSALLSEYAFFVLVATSTPRLIFLLRKDFGLLVQVD